MNPSGAKWCCRPLIPFTVFSQPDLNVADNNLKLDYVIRSMVTFVNVDSALDQLVALCESWGPFSILLMVGHDWDDKAIWHQSMTLLAEEVMPYLN